MKVGKSERKRSMPVYTKKSVMPVIQKKLFAWHENPCALERLTPPWNKIKVVHKDEGLQPGSKTQIKLYFGPIPFSWIARHTKYVEGEVFCDTQIKGPFSKWTHEHKMIQKSETDSFLEDRIHYKTFGNIYPRFVHNSIERLFTYRHRTLHHDLQVYHQFPSKPLKIALTGASGLIGSELAVFLRNAGHHVLPIVRREAKKDEVFWNIDSKIIEADKLEGLDAVINLAGENIGTGRWSSKKKKAILDSRIKGTAFLVETLNRLKSPPKVFISASGAGYYGSNLQTPAHETSPPGKDFLAQVCEQWEEKAKEFDKGRLVIIRPGVILSPKGGALKKMLLPFKLGLGGKLGSGKQLISWITIDDLIYQIYRILLSPHIEGPVNLCAPKPISNMEFSKTLATTLFRPCIFSQPSFLVKTIFGEMAENLLLSSIDVRPSKLEKAEMPFYYSDLSFALRHLLGKG